MFENSLPYDQGLKHNIIINPRNIFYRDPRDIIIPKPIIIIGKPNVSKDQAHQDTQPRHGVPTSGGKFHVGHGQHPQPRCQNQSDRHPDHVEKARQNARHQGQAFRRCHLGNDHRAQRQYDQSHATHPNDSGGKVEKFKPFVHENRLISRG